MEEQKESTHSQEVEMNDSSSLVDMRQLKIKSIDG
jgi:hypothetical protein